MDEKREVSKEDLILQIASQGKFDKVKIEKRFLFSKKTDITSK